MQLGLALPQYDYSVPGVSPLPFDDVVEAAQRAEQAGYDSVWLADHLFLSVDKYGGPPGDHWGYDPLVALAGIARATKRVRVGTLVLCAQLRPPAVLADALASLDVVSRGRLIAGIGAGWFEPEYRAADVPFERDGVRIDQLGEVVQVLTGMLGGATFSFEGAHYRVPGARSRPAPVQRPRPPVWVGARGTRALTVTAAYADGWNMRGWDTTPEQYRERLGVFEAACARAGRDPETVTRSVNQRYEGSVPEMRDRLRKWRDVGVSTLIVGLGALPFSLNESDDIERVASARP
ncbi:MAG: TIGR03619 family F420-dependent LLM class oxidoreductase [Actinobacteria bacterium]|nr:TIGR03619 family F420-dependent LLM class oxidoreductase [Actinomycetota bacterium]MBV9253794.1 TIGR03619 family F420-dependent LLM class oxidoreductase [Actinomycetota bacterium]